MNTPTENPPSRDPLFDNPPFDNPPSAHSPTENPPTGNPFSESPRSESPPTESPATAASATPARGRRVNRRFLLHYVEMLVAMVVGMLLLDPVSSAALSALGASGLHDRPDVGALVMAADMTIGMSIWMRLRRHGWASIAEMGAAMFVPFLLLLLPHWTGLLSGEGLLIAGHVLMLPAMLIAMLHRREEYTGHHHARPTAKPARD